MKRGDMFMFRAFVVLLAICAVIRCYRYFRYEGALVAVITQNGNVVRTIVLDGAAQEEFVISDENGGGNTIRIADGEISVVSADCPDKDCVRRGALRRTGESVVCLPHRLVIRISGAPEVDGATY